MKKGDIEMISYVMANFPTTEFSEVVTIMKQNGIANKTINDLRLAVRDKWERLVETKTQSKTKEESLNMSGDWFTKLLM
jgi:hypothetical protein